jgi:hypothetical protein
MAGHSRTVGSMHCAHTTWAQCGGLSNGRSEILNLVAHMPDGRILDILLLGVGALTLHRYDVHRVLIWFVPGALLLGCRGEQL